MKKDIRWIQRLRNFTKALSNLNEVLALSDKRELNKFEKLGLIHAFEIVHEHSWSILKDYFTYQGETEIRGSRDTYRLAFNRGLIADGQLFMKIIESRQLTSHSYNEDTAEEIFADVKALFTPAFNALSDPFQSFVERENAQ